MPRLYVIHYRMAHGWTEFCNDHANYEGDWVTGDTLYDWRTARNVARLMAEFGGYITRLIPA